ncbi:carbohydrate ABC transporter permease [Ktedonosporobacter rubrisoli]|uniref:Carbohydrate ABC transporter permease n=1 Tax=Ktedonosporobacter rubrisoli TaxID=2509675 RepID=A0A4P6JU04_KTERU|nr:carbohydrate ABC transporter permease [Ktedonosporobacter rubrisoli]QBD79088.1 carbohydrate ABC transporter permease [Ktedonosporobacter rubrisoli]
MHIYTKSYRVSQERWQLPARSLQYLIMAVLIFTMLFPFFWMIASSVKLPAELGAVPPIWWSSQPSLAPYKTVFEVIPFARALLNSLIVTISSTVGVLVTSIMAGYIFAKHDFRGKNMLFVIVLATMMVPQFVMLIPLYRMMNELGLVNTYPGLILPNLANGFGIFLMRQFISGIPDELLEAARIDGASEWTILWRVITPLLRPAISALILFAFVFQWNNFLWPLTIVNSQDMSTVVLMLNGLRTYTSSVSFTNIVMAGAVIGILPSVALTLWAQRYFIEGISMTGIKG